MLRRRGRSQQPDTEPGGTGDAQARVRASYDNEFDAYLAGAYIDWLLLTNQSIPAWAWVNPVAHGTIDELRELTHGIDHTPRGRSDVEVWRVVTTFIAKEVLAAARDASELVALQQRVLVPIELRLAENWWGAVAPTEVATTVLVALQNIPR